MTRQLIEGDIHQYEMEGDYVDELLAIGMMERGASPSNPPSKRTKGHAIPIPIHTKISFGRAEVQEQGNELMQDRFSDSLNFKL